MAATPPIMVLWEDFVENVLVPNGLALTEVPDAMWLLQQAFFSGATAALAVICQGEPGKVMTELADYAEEIRRKTEH